LLTSAHAAERALTIAGATDDSHKWSMMEMSDGQLGWRLIVHGSTRRVEVGWWRGACLLSRCSKQDNQRPAHPYRAL
jgi:hypothetical protein